MTRDQVQNLASLARLRFTTEELDTIAKEFTSIVEYVSTIVNADIHEAEFVPDLDDASEAVRADVAGDCLPVNEALRNGPSTNEAFFKVPRVLG